MRYGVWSMVWCMVWGIDREYYLQNLAVELFRFVGLVGGWFFFGWVGRWLRGGEENVRVDE